MDDGHQNASIEKAYSIVVVDGAYGFGNGRLLPAGPLREPAATGLGRADAAIVMGPDETGMAGALPGRLTRLRGNLVPLPDSTHVSGKRVVAFAGIARPEKFFRTLSALGCRIEAAKAFPDHHRFKETEISNLIDTANATDAIPVTTAKDAVRLPQAFRDAVRVLHVALEWEDEAAAEALVDEIEDRARFYGRSRIRREASESALTTAFPAPRLSRFACSRRPLRGGESVLPSRRARRRASAN